MGKQALGPILSPGTDVKANDGDTACSHPYGDGDNDLEKLHYDAYYSHGNLGILGLPEDGVQSAVLPNHIVNGGHSGHQRDLRKQAAQT